MKPVFIICRIALLMTWGCMSLSCEHDHEYTAHEGSECAPVEIQLTMDGEFTRAFANDNTHRVNRVLILPFRKVNETLTNDDQNFAPAYSLAVQRDVSQFPLNNAVVHLPVQSTYKLLVIGYNQTDYNYADRSNPANKFDLGSVSGLTTLANFHVYPKSATVVPELFTCIGSVYNGATPVGSTFRPEQGYSVAGTLSRQVSGFSIAISNIPTFVKSVSLVAENLVKASKATDASIVLYQTSGDGGNRLISKMTPPSSGSLTFNAYLLPTFDSNKTGFFLDVEYGAYTQRYTVKVPDSDVSSGNKFTLNPNHAINITGDYSKINIGFNLSFTINLDDNVWDGLQ